MTASVGTAASGRTRARAFLVLAGAVYLGSVVAMAATNGPSRVALVVAAAVVQLAMLTAGAIIALRSEVPRLGWLLVVTGATLSYWSALQLVPSTTLQLDLANSVAPLVVVPFMLVLATFPTGRAPDRFGRAVIRFAIAGSTISVALMLAASLGLLEGGWTRYRFLFDWVVLGLVLGVTASHVRSYRARPRVEQLQLKYFTLVLVFGAVQLSLSALGVEGMDWLDSVMPGVISVTILLAITRYRLYDIDRFVSRTAAYAVVVATLALLGVGGVVVVTSLLPAQDRLAVALSTVAVVALFDPLRRRAIDVVDRRFDRTRYVARQVVDGFGRDVQDVTDVGEIADRVHAVVGRTLAPSTLAVWQPTSPGRGGTS